MSQLSRFEDPKDRRRGGINFLNVFTVMIVGAALMLGGSFIIIYLFPDLVPGLSNVITPPTPYPTPTLIARAQLPTATSTPSPEALDEATIVPTWTPVIFTTVDATATNTRQPT
ncbi:MAG TPA: hypothetical protein VLL52_11825, partial [Anaerolineae bacterium]|nr:hypothetical protein [Anaerolineae bacterium]